MKKIIYILTHDFDEDHPVHSPLWFSLSHLVNNILWMFAWLLVGEISGYAHCLVDFHIL